MGASSIYLCLEVHHHHDAHDESVCPAHKTSALTLVVGSQPEALVSSYPSKCALFLHQCCPDKIFGTSFVLEIGFRAKLLKVYDAAHHILAASILSCQEVVFLLKTSSAYFSQSPPSRD